MLFFLWLDLFPFHGPLAPLAAVNFSMCYLLAATFYYRGYVVPALALFAGIAADAFSGTAVHTAVFIGLYYGAALLRGFFYRPGSAFHVLSYVLLVAAADAVTYYAVTPAGGAGFPVLFIAGLVLADYALFLLMLWFFREPDRVQLYKMR